MSRARMKRHAPAGPIWSIGVPLPLSAFRGEITDDTPGTWTRQLNEMLAEPLQSTEAAIRALIQRTLDARAVAGAHLFPVPPAGFLESGRQRVLLIDERLRPAGASPLAARARRLAFLKMASAAQAAHPAALIWIAPSGDGGHGPWLSSAGNRHGRALPFPCATAGAIGAMLPHIDHVYVIGASEGMQALMAGKAVHVYGTPNYAGWGLSDDAHPLAGRSSRPSITQLFECLFLRLATYMDPATHQAGDIDKVLAHIELQASVRAHFSDLRNIAGVRFQWWKRPYATPYLQAGGGALRWESIPERLASSELAATWGGRDIGQIPAGVAPLWMEDGFLHSDGLGSDLIPPRSQILDRTGIYFDATRPNDLLAILNDTEFGEAELRRAAALRAFIAANGITKYNLGRRRPQWLPPAGANVILVIGQVANDASIRLGTGNLNTAEGLLATVRERNPDAFLVYKPHPDVLSGNRQGLVDAQALADVVDKDADIISLIESADAIHTLSSLAGFDALMRGKPVFTYGLPFYAGWGLTVDDLPQPRRARRLTLDMLAAGALIRYPVYWDWKLRMYTTPEAIALQLAPAAARHGREVRKAWPGKLAKAKRWLRNGAAHLMWLMTPGNGTNPPRAD